MNSHDVMAAIEAIAATGSRNEKEALVERHIQDPLFKRVLVAAYDTFVTYGVTPPKVKKFGDGTFSNDSEEPWHLLDVLASRDLTGNAAKAAVKEALETLDPLSSSLLYRILAKDLRAGFGKNTVNRVLPGTIVTFDVMLSKGFEAKRVKEWPVAVEPKLDGLRAMSLCKDGASKAFSRVGNHFPALDHLSFPIAEMVERAHHEAKALAQEISSRAAVMAVYYKMLGGDAGPSLAIDAEAITGGFNKTSGDVKRKSVSADDAVLHVFDCLPYALVTADDQPEIRIPYRVRRNFTEFVVSHAAGNAPIVVTPMKLALNEEGIWEIVQQHWAAGLEGGMVKLLKGHYHKKRHHDLMKIKGEETEDLRINGWFTGKEGTRLEGKFAGFTVLRNGVSVRVGGGFSHEQLEEFDRLVRADLEELDRNGATLEDPSYDGQPRALHRLIEVEYHEVTPDGSLRHPRFVAFRDDKDEALKVAA